MDRNGVFDKERHSSLEFEKQASEAPFKQRASAPVKARTAVSAYEALCGGAAFRRRVSEAVHTRNLPEGRFVAGGKRGSKAAAASGPSRPSDDLIVGISEGPSAAARDAGIAVFNGDAMPGDAGAPDAQTADPMRPKSAIRAFSGAFAHEARVGVRRTLLRSPRSVFYKSRQIGLEAAAEQSGIDASRMPGTDAEADASVESVFSQLDPVTLRGEASFVANSVLPAGRARARLDRWDSKSNIARGKAATLTARADRIAARSSDIDPKTLRGRWIARRQARLRTKAAKQNAAGDLFAGQGEGLRGRAMAARRKKAEFTKKAFGMRGVARALAAGSALLVGGLLLLILFGAMFSSAGSSSSGSAAGLTGSQQVIANYMLSHDIDALHTAAVMGNIYQESRYNPAAVNPSSGAFGICQWLGGRKDALFDLAAERRVPATDLQTQLDWFLKEYDFEPGATGGWLQQAHRDRFVEIKDLDQAVEHYARRFERCGEGEANMSARIAEARRIYAALTQAPGGLGQDYASASEAAKRIVNACYTTPSPGEGYCAAWVSHVYENAGFGYPGGNACDMYWNFCTSSSMADLKVGMIVAVPSWTGTSAGLTYGHVAIYIGDGRVMDNVGPIRTTTLDEWIACYSTTYPVKWGYAARIE